MAPLGDRIPVELDLVIAQVTGADVLDFRRQFTEHCCFKTAQGKR